MYGDPKNEFLKTTGTQIINNYTGFENTFKFGFAQPAVLCYYKLSIKENEIPEKKTMKKLDGNHYAKVIFKWKAKSEIHGRSRPNLDEAWKLIKERIISSKEQKGLIIGIVTKEEIQKMKKISDNLIKGTARNLPGLIEWTFKSLAGRLGIKKK